MVYMKELLKLTERIKNPDLKKKTLSMVRNPVLSNKHFPKKKSRFENAPASLSWHHAYEGGLLEHTISITKMSIKIAETLKSVYKIDLDMDVLIAGCILHDAVKVFEYVKGKDGWVNSDMLLDHTMLGTSELYARGFPPEVIHMVASHFGAKGPTPPMTIEAKILSTIDLFDAEFEGGGDEEDEGGISLLDLLKEVKE